MQIAHYRNPHRVTMCQTTDIYWGSPFSLLISWRKSKQITCKRDLTNFNLDMWKDWIRGKNSSKCRVLIKSYIRTAIKMSQFDNKFSDYLVYQHLVEQGNLKTAKLLLQVNNFQNVPFVYRFIKEFDKKFYILIDAV